jgi:hypothetical protein
MSHAFALDARALRSLVPQASMYLMLGCFVGFLLFYDAFHYYCEPFKSSLPSWLLVLALGFAGVLACFLYPDIVHVMLSMVLLPLLGAVFCFLLFISPAFSPDIVGSLSDWLFELARYIIFDVILASVVIFCSGFISLYIFDTD